MFNGVRLDTATLIKSCEQAGTNWRWWQKDFEHGGTFGTLPLLNDYPRFLGFGFDYSVFRGLKRDHLEEMQEWFGAQPDPQSFRQVFNDFCGFSRSIPDLQGRFQNRVSLISKLLCLWRPKRYPMWDTLARKGLRKLHNNSKGHGYWETDYDTYNLFKADFFNLHITIKDQLVPPKSKIPEGATPEVFSLRVLDSYLMIIGEGDRG